MAKPNHTCPLCKGSGAVSARVAKSKITVVNREKYNETMRAVNERARLRRKAKEASKDGR